MSHVTVSCVFFCWGGEGVTCNGVLRLGGGETGVTCNGFLGLGEKGQGVTCNGFLGLGEKGKRVTCNGFLGLGEKGKGITCSGFSGLGKTCRFRDDSNFPTQLGPTLQNLQGEGDPRYSPSARGVPSLQSH